MLYLWRRFYWWINYYWRNDIDEVRVISAFWHKSKYKSKYNFDLFWKESRFLGFPCSGTREDFSIDVSFTNVGLIFDEARPFLFSGYGQTDRYDFGILIWKHVGTQTISIQSSKLRVSSRSLYATSDDGNAWKPCKSRFSNSVQ